LAAAYYVNLSLPHFQRRCNLGDGQGFQIVHFTARAVKQIGEKIAISLIIPQKGEQTAQACAMAWLQQSGGSVSKHANLAV
jgi:hypothetical protein